MICKKQVARRFGKMSSSYDKYARVQKYMALILANKVQRSGAYERILEIGCGTGYFTRLLAETFPKAHILASDISPGMLDATQKNLVSYPHIRYTLEDGESLKTQESFDLIVSNAAFQWFNQTPRAFNGFYDRLTPGGALIYTTFGKQTFQELHASFQAAQEQLGIASYAKHGQSLLTIPSLQNIMKLAGFTQTVHSEEKYQEYFPTVKDFLISVKKIGANNASQHNGSTTSRQLMFAMIRHYEDTFREHGQIYATYHTICGIGRK